MRHSALLALLLASARALAADVPGLYGAFKARTIGPANMSGRVCDIAVDERRPSTIYVATASGGLWKTTNNGGSWTSLLDATGVWSVGAVAVSPADPKVVWAGSGEANPRNSVSWGDGVYRSNDGGATWANVGLRDTLHVGRIVAHPTRPEVAFVAALGHVWGPNAERGLFKTEDGGKTWVHALKLDADTGCVDVALSPKTPNIVFAAAWQVRRGPYSGGNPETHCGRGGIYRSLDGGATWMKLTNGLPQRSFGRIGLAVDRNDPRRVVAVIATDKTPATTTGSGSKANAGEVDLGGVFVSDNGGDTWAKVNDLCPRPFYYGQVRLDPSDPRRVYVLGVQFFASDDGGKSFKAGAPGTHSDHHALWVDPRDPDHLIDGNDGGLCFSYDRGKSWERLFNLPVSQVYGVAADGHKPYRVTIGLQDNGTWSAPSRTSDPAGVTVGDWGRIMGADGFRCAADPVNADTVYCESQYGGLRRYDRAAGRLKNIKPKPERGEPAYRFNWNAPLCVSPHEPKTIYYGGNHLFRSRDRGDTWQAVSPDLTAGLPGPAADSGHTLTAIAESPAQAGRLYAGSDDGRMWTSPDGGATWVDSTNKLPMPPGRTVHCVECSHAAPQVAYAAVSRHRQDDRTPYLFRTDDAGATWKPAVNGLPAGAVVHVVRESSRNRNLLFAGTERGLFVSRDAGANWSPLAAGMPPVPVHDLAIHPTERELVIGTHGRGVYVLDVSPLEGLTGEIAASPAHLFPIRDAALATARPSNGLRGGRFYVGENPPAGAHLWVYLSTAAGEAKLTIADAAGKLVATPAVTTGVGLQRVVWGLTPPRRSGAIVPGEYTATLAVGKHVQTRKFRVEGRATGADTALEPDVP